MLQRQVLLSLQSIAGEYFSQKNIETRKITLSYLTVLPGSSMACLPKMCIDQETKRGQYGSLKVK